MKYDLLPYIISRKLQYLRAVNIVELYITYLKTF